MAAYDNPQRLAAYLQGRFGPEREGSLYARNRVYRSAIWNRYMLLLDRKHLHPNIEYVRLSAPNLGRISPHQLREMRKEAVESPSRAALEHVLSMVGPYDLHNANLCGARIQDANLAGVDLSGANLARARLTRVILTDATLVGADLTRAKLYDCILTGADLSGARLYGAQFDRSIAEARYATRPSVDFSRASAHDSRFVNVRMPRARFAAADVSDADFYGADLRYAVFTDAIATGAIFNHTYMVYARLERAQMDETEFEHAQLGSVIARGGNFRMANMTDTAFSRADLTDADLSYAFLNAGALDDSVVAGVRLEQIIWHDPQINR